MEERELWAEFSHFGCLQDAGQRTGNLWMENRAHEALTFKADGVTFPSSQALPANHPAHVTQSGLNLAILAACKMQARELATCGWKTERMKP